MWQFNHTQYNPNELYHHGILGMKWGVRRYQNPDGTLTPAGKKRYSDGDKNSGVSPKKNEKLPSSAKSDTTNKSIKEMSDDELNRLISRLQKEKQLKALLNDEPISSDKNQSAQKQGNSYISKSLKEGGSQALTAITKTVALYIGGKIIASMFNNPELGKSISGLAYNSSSTKKNDSSSEGMKSKQNTASKQSAQATTSKTSSKKTSPASDSKNDPIDAIFKEAFDVKFKDIKGEGSSKYKPDSDTVIDVDFKDVVDAGSEFINNYMNQLLLPPYERKG